MVVRTLEGMKRINAGSKKRIKIVAEELVRGRGGDGLMLQKCYLSWFVVWKYV